MMLEITIVRPAPLWGCHSARMTVPGFQPPWSLDGTVSIVDNAKLRAGLATKLNFT